MNRAELFLREMERRVLIMDGAMGTTLNTFNLSVEADYGGSDQENNHEILNVRRPDAIARIHAGYYEVGADAVETNSFNANRVSLRHYNMADRAYELNVAAARVAREVADEYTKRDPAKPRFVIGACGPTNKMIVVGDHNTAGTFDEFHEAYCEQVEGLIDGGADVILFETSFDVMALKAGVIAAGDVFKKKGVKLPLMAQVAFVKPSDDVPANSMLCGTDMSTLIATLEDFDQLDILGMNCATGPDEMSPHVAHLCRHSNKRVSVLPNAGLPRMLKGKTHFPMGPEDLAVWIRRFVEQDGVNIVGGCCGTHAGHIAEIVKAVGNRAPKTRTPVIEHCVASMTQAVTVKQNPAPLMVGERTNSKGSKKFNKLMLADDLDGMAKMGVDQVREGAHVLDVCVAEVGRNDIPTMNAVVERFRQSITLPLMIDTTQVDCVEEALKRYPGKAIINSINLEDGREKMERLVRIAKRHNAAMVALTIDEDRQEGMGKTRQRKLEIARRIYDICTKEFGVKPQDLLFDPLTFTIGAGLEESRTAGIETLEGIRLIKKEMPEVGTILGLSNISFGLNPPSRKVLNSVFMHYALQAGLDAAIVHVSQIVPTSRIPDKQVEAARRLVFNEWVDGKDPLQEFLALFTDAQAAKAEVRARGTVEEELKRRIIEGDRVGIDADLVEARGKHAPLDIINNILLEGMKVVGDLFGAGKMQLPFVLQSAETMKAAVAQLEPFLEKVEGQTKGRLVLATVKGDVHDIGKNLVDIILTNNGYTVFNLGIKQPINAVLEAAEKHKAHAVGLSGLLVKSTVVMKEDLEELNRRGRLFPVLLGGAALTRAYVEDDLRDLYQGNVFYCRDAFDGLHVMDRLMADGVTGAGQPRRDWTGIFGSAPVAVVEEPALDEDMEPRPEPVPRGAPAIRKAPPGARSDVKPAPSVPVPPFWGSRAVSDISCDEVYKFINHKYLFRQQWQFSKGSMEHQAFLKQERENVWPIFDRVSRKWADEHVLQPKVVYGYYPCNSHGDDVIVFDPKTDRELVRFTFPRQPSGKYLCIADFFLPLESGKRDVLALHCVTVGEEPSRVEKVLFAANEYREYLYLHGLSVETTEALAEYWHKRIRTELGIADTDPPELQQLFQQKYRGSRYSFGYPACPNLEDQQQLFTLLQPERIGITLTEEWQLVPEQSTSAIIVHHPSAKYFNIR